ncbi:MAG: hypothetical protein NVSMB64_10680 [Candidatus Velthaea sp.]
MTSNAPDPDFANVSASSAPKKKRSGFVPRGTPFQQQQRLRSIERQLVGEAARMRGNAANLDSLRSKIEATRLSGEPVKRELLSRIVRTETRPGSYYIAKLVGSKSSTYEAIIDAMWPQRHAPTPAPMPIQSFAPGGSRAALPVASPADPLTEATSIVRSASGEIDWSREPLTDRERRIRAKFIEQQSEQRSGGSIPYIAMRLRLDSKPVASDLREADAQSRRILKEEIAGYERRNVAEAIDALDD